MSKLISTSNLSKLSKALDERCIDLINEEKERAMGIEQGLQTNISNKADADHNHDDRYFTETEMNTKIGEINEAINGHVADLNAAISGKADTSHNHDDMYYTETEIDVKIEDINETINTNVSTLNTAIAIAKSGAISESKSYTDTAIANLVDSAPEAMNTLNELAKAIGDHQTEYEAYVATVAANIATAKNETIAEADEKDTALHTTISAEIDADVKVEKERAIDAENALQAAIDAKADAGHNHDDQYYTETEINTKLAGKADISHNHDDMYYTETEIDGKITTLNNAIAGKADTLQSRISELEAALNPEVHEITVSDGILTLTNEKYQKCNNIVDGTEIVFPSVSKFTEIHLYFDADSNMNLTFPDCKWRVEPNIEEGGTYEVIATYNTVYWLVTIIAYS